ncbi:inhibitor of apoptosis-promoting Bax1-domain-containing protein [Dioszegia hungarica]|uniref:Inhibitor of apoptosis-promoting Bax1-domain-containing protein n=1 Tax=Dioszegia hungarica TaxID=4972 RepID=A0AA38LTX2_9TREE|nr:inhibitor of apoptosis-promoting Bax1-domain-containing protein [Dioszegia hungarica]KAI9633854.1 inhibitor of apoptosis-promoting Bax1-domain-containing protein [Dioszegia hungarica]
MSAPPQYSDQAPASPPSSKGSKSKYGATAPSDVPSTAPLLAQSSMAAGASRNAWMDQAADDDLPDDFKVGVTVIDCDVEIRVAFIRKVYSILFVQLLATSLVALAMSLPAAIEFTHANPWTMWVPMLGSLVALFGVYWKRHEHPLNLVLVGLFTLLEAVMIGSVTSYYESRIVLQALFITLGVFTGLTLFTFQTKYDFSSFAPFLFAGIWGLITASVVSIFLPFNANFDLVLAGGSVLLFSAFVLYDTQQIMKRLSVDEYVLGALSLYLDAINLFLSVLRVLNNTNDR